MRAPKTLSVYPNPWHGDLDHNERPRNACAYPHDGSQFYTMRWLGAEPMRDEDGDQYFLFECLDPSTLEFRPSTEPTKVPAGSSEQAVRWMQAIRQGEVLAADVQTYSAVFGRAVTEGPADPETRRRLYYGGHLFVPPAEMMAIEKAHALHRLEHVHKRGAHDPKPYSEWKGLSERVAKAREDAIAAATAAQIARARQDEETARQAAMAAAQTPDAKAAAAAGGN